MPRPGPDALPVIHSITAELLGDAKRRVSEVAYAVGFRDSHPSP